MTSKAAYLQSLFRKPLIPILKQHQFRISLEFKGSYANKQCNQFNSRWDS